MINCAIIGLGQIGYKIDQDPLRNIIWSHAKTYFTHDKVNFVAVSDINEKNYIDFNQYYNGIDFCNNYVSMISEYDIDIVSICTPNNTHYEIIRDILQHHQPKAIFLEKPMGSNLSEGKSIIELCEKKGVVLAINYMRRWEEKYIYIKKIIDEKKYGELKSITAFGCTSLLTSTSHLIDLFLYFGGKVDWIIGELQEDYIRNVNGVNDPGGIAFTKFSNNGYGYIKGTSIDSKHYMFELDLLFANGRIRISDDGRSISEWSFYENNTSTGSGYMNLQRIPNDNFFVQNERMISAVDDIIFCINNKSKPKSNGYNALDVHKFIDAIKNSPTNQNHKVSII